MVNESFVEKVAFGKYMLKNSVTHSWKHTKRVACIAKILAKNVCEKYLDDVIIAAYFHDVGRTHDAVDNKHGARGAEIARITIATFWPSTQLESILFAIKHHADKIAPNGGLPIIDNYESILCKNNIIPQIAACVWDADRLDLARFPHKTPPKLEYLSLEYAKKIANAVGYLKLYHKIHKANSIFYKK